MIIYICISTNDFLDFVAWVRSSKRDKSARLMSRVTITSYKLQRLEPHEYYLTLQTQWLRVSI